MANKVVLLPIRETGKDEPETRSSGLGFGTRLGILNLILKAVGVCLGGSVS